MKKYRFNYEYESIEGNENQYDYESLNNKAIVDAKYRKAINSYDRGNPFIEALPFPRDFNQSIIDYLVPLKDYDSQKIKKLSKGEKIINIDTLREFRVPLPFVYDLESNFYNALTQSYRTRYIVNNENYDKTLYVNNNKVITNSITYANSDDAANSSFGLIGYAGCGKSSSLKILLENYPQVIMHHPSPGSTICQIVYLVVNCAPNSNFNALYTSIAHAIDKALGNIEPIYERIFQKNLSLGAKTLKIRELIETFSIGIIILDEIQLIDFSSNREASFESLMSLTNITKVPFVIVGTEDALDKMFSKLRTARRVGKIINADAYISNREYFNYVISLLFKYQWFENSIEATEEITDMLYKKTRGIISYLIEIYISATVESLNKKGIIVDAEFFDKIADNKYPNMQKKLKTIEPPEQRNRKFNEFSEFNNKLNLFLDKDKQSDMIAAVKSQRNDQISNITKINNVISNIDSSKFDCSNDIIDNIARKVVLDPKNHNKSEKDLSVLVTKKIQNNAKNGK